MTTNMKKYELTPTDGRKSFYGKAQVVELEDGGKILKSYSTIVASMDAYGKFHRHWGGYSATTMRHINSFLDFCGLYGGGKSWWDRCPVEPITERSF